jgi:hypothetical protein
VGILAQKDGKDESKDFSFLRIHIYGFFPWQQCNRLLKQALQPLHILPPASFETLHHIALALPQL